MLIDGRGYEMANTQELKQSLARKAAILQGDAERIAKQHADGKLTARERVEKLLDEGSFVELDALVSKGQDYAGVVTGYGTVQDRPVYVFAQDFTVHGGAMGSMQAKKICKVLDLALPVDLERGRTNNQAWCCFRSGYRYDCLTCLSQAHFIAIDAAFHFKCFGYANFLILVRFVFCHISNKMVCCSSG